MGGTHDLSCYSRDGCIVDYSRLPLDVAWGRATLNPTAVAESKVIAQPVHGGTQSSLVNRAKVESGITRKNKMAEKTRPRRRFFTVDEAECSFAVGSRHRLPIWSPWLANVLDRRQRLSSLLEGRKASSGDAYTDELRSMQKTLDRDSDDFKSSLKS